MAIGLLGMVAFNMADTFFVSKLGTIELAALSFTFPVVFIVASIALGLGMGTSSVVSRAVGEGNNHKVEKLTTDGMLLAVLSVAVFAVAGIFTIEQVFGALGAGAEILPYIRQYMFIWYAGVVFVVVPMVGNNAIRAIGDTKTPSIIMLVAVVTNLVLDPVLIFGYGPFPRMELAGAALATVISRAITLVFALWILGYREKMLIFAMPGLKRLYRSWKEVLYVGIPTAGTRMIIPVALGIITKMVSSYGPEAVAAFGVASRIEFFALVIIFALASVLAPFTGQNWGSGNINRVHLGLRYGEFFSVLWGLAVMGFLFLFAGKIAAVFNDDPAVKKLVILYLKIVPAGFGLQGILIIANSVLNVLHKPLRASALVILEMFVLYIPMAVIGEHFYGLKGVFASLAAAYIISGIIALNVVNRTLKNSA